MPLKDLQDIIFLEFETQNWPQIEVDWESYFESLQNHPSFFGVGLFVLLFLFARKIHIWRIYQILNKKQFIKPDEPHLWEERLSKLPASIEATFNKMAVHPGGFSAIEEIFQWSKFEPNILKAFDKYCNKKIFQSHESLKNHLEKFLDNQHFSVQALSARYSDYVERKKIADYLISQGHLIQEMYPFHPEGFNALVDGQKVIFKGASTPMVKHLQLKETKYQIFIFNDHQNTYKNDDNVTLLPFGGEKGAEFHKDTLERFMIEANELGTTRQTSGLGKLGGKLAGNFMGDEEVEDVILGCILGFLGDMAEKACLNLGPDRELRKAYQNLAVLFCQYPEPYGKALQLKAQALSKYVSFLTLDRHGTWLWPNMAYAVRDAIFTRYDNWAKKCQVTSAQIMSKLSDFDGDSERAFLGYKVFFSNTYEVVYSKEIAKLRSEIWKNLEIVLKERRNLNPELSRKVFPKHYLWKT